MNTFRKIAVLRANALGDFIFGLPTLSALRQTFPDSEIYYLGKAWHAQFLKNRPSPIDEVVVIPPVAGVSEKNSYQNNDDELHAFFEIMNSEKFDLAVQLHGGGKFSNEFINKIGAIVTIGTKTRDAESLTYSIPYRYYQNEYMRWLEVVSLVGAKTSDPMPHIKTTDNDFAEVATVLHNDDRKIIILHPGATDIRRRWQGEKFAAVGDYFSRKGFRVILTGSGDEKDIVEGIIKTMHFPADNFSNQLSLNGLTGLLSLASVVISNDTGPLHLADALGCNSIGLYWCGNLINAAPPFRKNHMCLGSWMVQCPLCKKDCASYFPFENTETSCLHEVSFVDSIPIDAVISAAEEFLDRS